MQGMREAVRPWRLTRDVLRGAGCGQIHGGLCRRSAESASKRVGACRAPQAQHSPRHPSERSRRRTTDDEGRTRTNDEEDAGGDPRHSGGRSRGHTRRTTAKGQRGQRGRRVAKAGKAVARPRAAPRNAERPGWCRPGREPQRQVPAQRKKLGCRTSGGDVCDFRELGPQLHREVRTLSRLVCAGRSADQCTSVS